MTTAPGPEDRDPDEQAGHRARRDDADDPLDDDWDPGDWDPDDEDDDWDPAWDPDWLESSEGDLDPDLSIESPYSDWDEPVPNPWWPVIMRLVVAFLIFALVAPIVLRAMV